MVLIALQLYQAGLSSKLGSILPNFVGEVKLLLGRQVSIEIFSLNWLG
jgi:hypothetical protein